MQEEFSFEERIKEKISAVRIHPSEKVWDALRHDLSRTFNPKIYFPVLIVLLGILIFSSLSISNHSTFLNPYLKQADLFSQKHSFTPAPNRNSKIYHSKENLDRFKIQLSPVGQNYTLASSTYAMETIHFKGVISQNNDLKKSFAESTNTIITEAGIMPASLKSESDFKQKHIANLTPVDHKGSLNALQFYIAPSFVYRLMSESGKSTGTNPDFIGDSSSFLMQSAGLEAGLSLWKPINNKWAIKSGFLINMSVYDPKGSSDLNNNTQLLHSGKTSISDKAINDNDELLSTTSLMNQNFRFSIPVEVEYKLVGNKAISFFMSGSLQPSFSIYSTGNLITSEFKDKIPVDPYLYRRFNVLTGLECFFRMNAGAFDIQAGPQIRYQLLSNNVGASPYREYLMDYSMKIGIIKKIN